MPLRTTSILVLLGVAMYTWAQAPTGLTTGQPLASPTNGVASPQPSAEKPNKGDVNTTRTDSVGMKYDPASYHIGVEDELTISVWHEQDLSMNVVVRPDGMITLPLLNDLKVIGMTTKELQDTLTTKLKELEFVKEPQVTVIVREIHSRKVYLVGQASKPGSYPLNDSKTVLQLLAEAGGPGPYAKLGSIYIIRQQGSTRKRLSFNYKKAISGKDISDDLVLQPGDMVVIP